jgi:hypothetical protein
MKKTVAKLVTYQLNAYQFSNSYAQLIQEYEGTNDNQEYHSIFGRHELLHLAFDLIGFPEQIFPVVSEIEEKMFFDRRFLFQHQIFHPDLVIKQRLLLVNPYVEWLYNELENLKSKRPSLFSSKN